MAEIDSLGSQYYYSGVQNASNNAIKRNTKTEENSRVKKSRFSQLLKSEKENDIENEFTLLGLPPEIQSMSIDDAAIYLKDAVDVAGNNLSDEINEENIEQFKTSVKQFITFVINNNFEISSKRKKNRLGHDMMVPSRTNFFSNYSLPPHKIDPKVQINTINEKLDALARMTLETQMDNLKILAKVDEIKGLIVDLMSS